MSEQWTLERRQQQAQAIQRWKPWEKATGPRTVEGKAIVARNAFKGGKRPYIREQMKEARSQLRAAMAVLDNCVRIADCHK